MKEYISFDSHKRYTLAEREDVATGRTRQQRIEHVPGAIRTYLGDCEPGTPVAVEAMGNWYWIVDEIEQAGLSPRLVHPRRAKLMMGMINKTDKLDVHGLNRLQRNQTLPQVWVAPGPMRDLRELTRTRLVLTRQRTRLKNRIHSALAKYGLSVDGHSDAFSPGARTDLEACLAKLPEQTQWTHRLLLEQLDFVAKQIRQHEDRLEQLLPVTPQMEFLMTLPGVGLILAATIAMEIGNIGRFASPGRLASYSGTTPRVKSSGGKTTFGPLRNDVNRYLKWAFLEAANAIVVHRRSHPDRHVSRLYERLAKAKGHPKAVGAVARHLAEASYAVLNGRGVYRDPALGHSRKA